MLHGLSAFLARNILARRGSLFLLVLCLLALYKVYQVTAEAQATTAEKSQVPREVAIKANYNTTQAVVKLTRSAKEDEKTLKRFQTRLKIIKSQCPGWRTSPYKSNWVSNKNFLINQKRHILICAVPKAGSTSWHMTVWAMRRKQAGLDPDTKHYTYEDTVFNHAVAGKLTPAEGKELVTYYDGDDDLTRNPPTEKTQRLILARHPFARLISGWHQKFLPQSSYADFMFKAFPQIRNYVKNKDPDHRMAWKDFARYVSGSAMAPSRLDYHFTPASELCKPCQYAYTYVLKAESVDKDEDWLRRRLNITDINVGRKGVPPGGSLVNANPSDNIKKYMAELDDDVRRRLYLVYREDFQLFGYTFDFKTLESGGFD